jgi:hypothetical protein
MRRTVVAALFGLAAAISTEVRGQEAVKGVDLFVDLDQYAGKQVLLTDGQVVFATGDGALVKSGGVTFELVPDGIDRETFRYILKNCSGLITGPECQKPLLVTPTGQKQVVSGFPVLAGGKFAQ